MDESAKRQLEPIAEHPPEVAVVVGGELERLCRSKGRKPQQGADHAHPRDGPDVPAMERQDNCGQKRDKGGRDIDRREQAKAALSLEPCVAEDGRRIEDDAKPHDAEERLKYRLAVEVGDERRGEGKRQVYCGPYADIPPEYAPGVASVDDIRHAEPGLCQGGSDAKEDAEHGGEAEVARLQEPSEYHPLRKAYALNKYLFKAGV